MFEAEILVGDSQMGMVSEGSKFVYYRIVGQTSEVYLNHFSDKKKIPAVLNVSDSRYVKSMYSCNTVDYFKDCLILGKISGMSVFIFTCRN